MSEVQNRDLKLDLDDFIIRLNRLAGLVQVIDDRLEGLNYGTGSKRNTALDEVALLTGIAADSLKQMAETLNRSSVIVLSSEWRSEAN